MPAAVTMHQRVQIVYLFGQKDQTPQTIAETVGVSVNCVNHWVKNAREGGDLSERRRSGRPREYSLQTAKLARAMLLREGFGGLAQAARALHRAGKTTRLMSRSTLLRLLREGECRGWRPIVPDRSRPTAALKQTTKQARLRFARENLSRDWDNVMFTDRKRFYFRYPGCHVDTVQWRFVGSRVRREIVSTAQCANVYLGMTKFGCTKPVLVAGSSDKVHTFLTKKGSPAKNITASEYKEVLTKHLLPQGQLLMRRNGQRSWVFQQDNDPTHRDAAAIIREYNQESNTRIKFLPSWPPHSPDLSLIENGWAWLQRELDRAGCRTFKSWLRKLEQLISSVPQEWLDHAYAGMTGRLLDTISLGGDKTRH